MATSDAPELVAQADPAARDEDHLRIRTGSGPENTTRLRRFAIGLVQARTDCVASALRRLNRNPRLVFDYLRMTRNTLRPHGEQISRGRRLV